MAPGAGAGRRDVIVVGAGLAGLVAACEIADGGRSVLLLEREGEQDLVPRPGGASAGCSWSTPRSSAGWGCATAWIWPARTGWDRPASSGPRTTGRAAGRRPTCSSLRGRNVPG